MKAAAVKEEIDLWKTTPFRTSAGTKLTGTTTRNILKMSFWYFVLPSPFFDEAELETRYTGVINDAPVMIAGRHCPTGTVKIETIEVIDNIWERPDVVPYQLKMVSVVLLLDNRTWKKRYENVSNLFMVSP